MLPPIARTSASRLGRVAERMAHRDEPFAHGRVGLDDAEDARVVGVDLDHVAGREAVPSELGRDA